MPLAAGAVPAAAGGVAAVEAGMGALLAEAAGAGDDGGGLLAPGDASLLPLGLLHPPIAKPIQATAIPSAVRFMVFS